MKTSSAPFAHLEILGPRASLDAMLAALQDHGACHLADALVGLEGEAGIGRPRPTPSEHRGGLLRSEAALVLHSVERVLPSSTADEEVSTRPTWSVAPGGRDEADTEALRDEALEVGGRIRRALEEARKAEHEVEAAEGEALEPARGELGAALTRLRERIVEDGPRARQLFDALEDAEARARTWQRLAATEHVASARVFVRPEDVDALQRRLSHAFGREVVVRELSPAPEDMPAMPRAVAGLPLAALEGLRPSRFGEIAASSLLALAVPLVFGSWLADLGGGLLLLLLGALIGAGVAPGSPRKDTALIAQLAGLVALVFGILHGQAFGDLGGSWFGADWGLLSEPASTAPATFVVRLGFVAALLALWGFVSALVNLKRGHPTRARGAAVGALTFALAALWAGLYWVPALAAGTWILAVAFGFVLAAAAIVLLADARTGLGGVLLDLVGFARLGAIALVAAYFFAWGFSVLLPPSALALIVGPASVLLGLLLVVIDPAYVAMGVPYDLALGRGALAQPFTPFARQVVRIRGVVRRAS